MQKNNPAEISKKTIEFVSFCVEMYAEENKMSGCSVFDMFEKNGTLGYLISNYEVLHTQGRCWLLCNISDFINAKGGIK